MGVTDAIVEPHPLWEYPSIACGESKKIFSWTFSEDPPSAPLFSSVYFDISRYYRLKLIAQIGIKCLLTGPEQMAWFCGWSATWVAKSE